MILNILLSMVFAAEPSTVLIKAPEANPHEFFVFAQNSGDIRVSQRLTSCDLNGKLNLWLKQGQYEFLNGSLHSAKKKFNTIIENKWNCDWREDERKIITFSFYRLAQLSEVPSEQLSFLTEAIGFDEDLPPSESIFPPPLVELYKKTKAQISRQSVVAPEFAKKFSGLYRNGKFISLSSLVLSAVPLRARYTWTSDTYLPETFVVSLDELQKYEIQPKPLVQGSCEKFTVAPEMKTLTDYKIFFGPECVPASKDHVTGLAPTAQGFTENLANTAPIGPRKKSWLERNLLWVGVAVVSSIAVSQMIKHNGDRDDSAVRPTNTLSEGN